MSKKQTQRSKVTAQLFVVFIFAAIVFILFVVVLYILNYRQEQRLRAQQDQEVREAL